MCVDCVPFCGKVFASGRIVCILSYSGNGATLIRGLIMDKAFQYDIELQGVLIGYCNKDKAGKVSEVYYVHKDENSGCVCPKCGKSSCLTLTYCATELDTDCCGTLDVVTFANV